MAHLVATTTATTGEAADAAHLQDAAIAAHLHQDAIASTRLHLVATADRAQGLPLHAAATVDARLLQDATAAHHLLAATLHRLCVTK